MHSIRVFYGVLHLLELIDSQKLPQESKDNFIIRWDMAGRWGEFMYQGTCCGNSGEHLRLWQGTGEARWCSEGYCQATTWEFEQNCREQTKMCFFVSFRYFGPLRSRNQAKGEEQGFGRSISTSDHFHEERESNAESAHWDPGLVSRCSAF